MWTNWSASVINVHYAKMQHQNKSIIGIFIIIVKINQHVWKSSKNANISLMLINLPTHNDGIMRSSPNHKVNSLYYRSSFFTWHWIIIFVFLADPEVLNPLWWIIFDLVQLDRDYLVEITVPGSSTEVFSVWGSNYCFPLPEPENFWSQWFFYHKQVWIASRIRIHGFANEDLDDKQMMMTMIGCDFCWQTHCVFHWFLDIWLSSGIYPHLLDHHIVRIIGHHKFWLFLG